MNFAFWWMNRLQVDSSLTGDITEEWAAGRSVWWLSWQTCIAILRALYSGLWHNKLRTLVAVMVGLFGWVFLQNALWYLSPIRYLPSGLLLFMLRPVLLGWIVGKLQPRQPLGTAVLFISAFIVATLWLSRHSSVDYRIVLQFGSWLILTTSIGGMLATRKPKSLPILG
jgi:hypothetical protein